MQRKAFVSSIYLDTEFMQEEAVILYSFSPGYTGICAGEAVVSSPYLNTGIHAGEGCCILPYLYTEYMQGESVFFVSSSYLNTQEYMQGRLLYPHLPVNRNTCRGKLLDPPPTWTQE